MDQTNSNIQDFSHYLKYAEYPESCLDHLERENDWENIANTTDTTLKVR